MTMVKTYLGLARLALAKKDLKEAMNQIETGLDMVEELLPNKITHANLLAVKGSFFSEPLKDLSHLNHQVTLICFAQFGPNFF